MRTLFGTDGIRGKAHQYPFDAPTMFALGEALAHRLKDAGVGGRGSGVGDLDRGVSGVGRRASERSNASATHSPLPTLHSPLPTPHSPPPDTRHPTPDTRFPTILLGMDTRESGPEIARSLTAGVEQGGGKAIFIGIVPTPAVAYLCRITDAAAGISISASHNPFEDNGVKIFGHDGMKIPDSVEEQIEDELRAIRRDGVTVPDIDLSDNTDLIERYERFLDDGIAPHALRGRKVVLDTGNGAAFRIAPEVFRRAGADVVVVNAKPNGRNINDGCGAMHPEGLATVVVEEKADFGVAFDGDADRAIFVDDAGKIRDGDEIIYLWAQRLKRDGTLQSGCVVTTVMSNFGFEQQLRADGIELCRANVGDKYVLEMMIERGASLGGEQSGHIIDLAVHTTGDGIHTALVFGELLTQAGRPFSQLRTFTPMPQLLLNEPVGSKPPLESLPKYQAALADALAQIEGKGRILVRYSGTENKVRVMVEGPDQGLIRRIAEPLRDVLAGEIR
ncbi:MAG TPA: phosphoglucosamine mutase, partial [Thermoanaerobaculia bacterium]|nr:phosphoglucosamine mutase [Thermoanaerobaculia bacterium]